MLRTDISVPSTAAGQPLALVLSAGFTVFWVYQIRTAIPAIRTTKSLMADEFD